MSETKQFGIGAILTITGEALMCDIGDVYKILGWLTGEEGLMTHQLPRASRESEGFLREQFPDLAAVEIPVWTEIPGWSAMGGEEKRTSIEAWLTDLGTKVGPTRDVPRLPAEDHTHIDPLTELQMLRPDAPVIVVNATPEDRA